MGSENRALPLHSEAETRIGSDQLASREIREQPSQGCSGLALIP
jgi:hypothetical protein